MSTSYESSKGYTTIITWRKAVGKQLPDACTREQIPDVGSRR